MAFILGPSTATPAAATGGGNGDASVDGPVTSPTTSNPASPPSESAVAQEGGSPAPAEPAERGALMAKAAGNTKGAMLAVQTDAETIKPVLQTVGQGLVLANDNGPDQVVLSGAQEAVEAAKREDIMGYSRLKLVADWMHNKANSLKQRAKEAYGNKNPRRYGAERRQRSEGGSGENR